MLIVLLIIGLIVIAWLAFKFNEYMTRCPGCGKMGTSKYLKRTFVGKSYNYFSRSSNKMVNEYSESYKCNNCGHQFSKRSRSSATR